MTTTVFVVGTKVPSFEMLCNTEDCDGCPLMGHCWEVD